VKKLEQYGYEAELITNGVNTDFFRPMDGGPMRDALGIAPDAFVLGFAGAVERWYALDEVIQAFPEILARHENAELLNRRWLTLHRLHRRTPRPRNPARGR